MRTGEAHVGDLFWTSWQAVARAAILCAGAYLSLVVLLRISGKRSTSKLNMFDWAMTVALGSMLAATALSTSIPLAAGVAAFATLIGLQFVIAWASVRSGTVRRIVKSEPALLYHRGDFLRRAMKKERIVEEEIRAVAREQGYGSLEAVGAVVLETDGELSILVADVPASDAGLLDDVRGAPSR